jgi:hypothetical protein
MLDSIGPAGGLNIIGTAASNGDGGNLISATF